MKKLRLPHLIVIAAISVAAIAIVFALLGALGAFNQNSVLERSGRAAPTAAQDATFGVPRETPPLPKGIAMDMDDGEEMMMEEMAAVDPTMYRNTAGSAAEGLDGEDITARIIKNGELRLRVDNASDAMDRVRSIVDGKSGFVEASSVSDSGDGPLTARMTLRIPVDSFEEVIGELKGIASLVLYESTSGQDVTSEFVDLEANLRNARAEEESYRAILDQSGSIEEVLMVTRQLASVRGRIEQLEGRKRYLENRTDLATLQLTLTEDTRIEAPTRKWEPIEVMKQSVRGLILGLQAFVDFLIRLVISVVGLLIPIVAFTWLIIWLGWKLITRIIKKVKGKKK